MPRRPRVFVNGALYHVYCRTAHGERVFAEAAEADGFLAIAREVLRRDGCTVHAWCVMANHYHLAVRTGRLPLWRTMRLVQGKSAIAHNRRARLFGPLWQGRYKAKLIEAEASLLRVIAYIHLNPVAAGVVDDPAKYERSGHRELLGRVASPLIDVDETLALFGPTRREARRAYLALLRGERQADWLGWEPTRAPWWRGADDGQALDIRPGRSRLDALGASTAPAHAPVEGNRLLAAAGKLLAIDPSEWRGRTKGRSMTDARELLATVAVEWFGMRINDLAGLLAMNPGSVGRVLARAMARRREDTAFARRLSRFETGLIDAIDGQTGQRPTRKR